MGSTEADGLDGRTLLRSSCCLSPWPHSRGCGSSGPFELHLLCPLMRERYRNAVEQRVAADEAGASDGASQLNAVLDRIRGAIGMAKVPFPDVQIGEFTVMRPFTAPGLFAYRHMQA